MAVLIGIAIWPAAPANLFDCCLFDTDGLPGGSSNLLVYADDQGVICLRDGNFAQLPGVDADSLMNRQLEEGL